MNSKKNIFIFTLFIIYSIDVLSVNSSNRSKNGSHNNRQQHNTHVNRNVSLRNRGNVNNKNSSERRKNFIKARRVFQQHDRVVSNDNGRTGRATVTQPRSRSTTSRQSPPVVLNNRIQLPPRVAQKSPLIPSSTGLLSTNPQPSTSQQINDVRPQLPPKVAQKSPLIPSSTGLLSTNPQPSTSQQINDVRPQLPPKVAQKSPLIPSSTGLLSTNPQPSISQQALTQNNKPSKFKRLKQALRKNIKIKTKEVSLAEFDNKLEDIPNITGNNRRGNNLVFRNNKWIKSLGVENTEFRNQLYSDSDSADLEFKADLFIPKKRLSKSTSSNSSNSSLISKQQIPGLPSLQSRSDAVPVSPQISNVKFKKNIKPINLNSNLTQLESNQPQSKKVGRLKQLGLAIQNKFKKQPVQTDLDSFVGGNFIKQIFIDGKFNKERVSDSFLSDNSITGAIFDLSKSEGGLDSGVEFINNSKFAKKAQKQGITSLYNLAQLSNFLINKIASTEGLLRVSGAGNAIATNEKLSKINNNFTSEVFNQKSFEDASDVHTLASIFKKQLLKSGKNQFIFDEKSYNTLTNKLNELQLNTEKGEIKIIKESLLRPNITSAETSRLKASLNSTELKYNQKLDTFNKFFYKDIYKNFTNEQKLKLGLIKNLGDASRENPSNTTSGILNQQTLSILLAANSFTHSLTDKITDISVATEIIASQQNILKYILEYDPS